MTGEVRFGESDEAGYAAFAWESVPDGVDSFESEVIDNRTENAVQGTLVAKFVSIASGRLDQPFGPHDHISVDGLLVDLLRNLVVGATDIIVQE